MPKPFDYSNSILKKKVYYEDVSGFVPFLMGKLFSNDITLAGIANYVNKIGVHVLPKRAIYDFYYYAVPRMNKWIKYPKGSADPKAVEHVMRYYICNELEAKDIIEILPKSDIKQIVDIYENSGVKK